MQSSAYPIGHSAFSASKLRISLIDSNGETIYSFEEKCYKYNSPGEFKGELKSYLMLSKRFDNSYIGDMNKCPSQLYDVSNNYSNVKFDITSQKDYGFAFEVNDLDKLKDFKEIKIEYLNK